MHLAAEFTISRPETQAGWIGLIFLGLVVLYILNQGIQSVSGIIREPIQRNVIAFGLLLLIVFLVANEAGWNSDPVGRVQVLEPSDAVQNPDGTSSLSGATTESGGGG